MSLWVDNYRRVGLRELELHDGVNRRLGRLARSSDLPHLLFYGPDGSGKRTRFLGLLAEIFGDGVFKVKVVQKSFKLRTKTVEISALMSNHHIELNPSDAGFGDRYVVQEVFKEIAETKTVNAENGFKVVVFNEADRLSNDAQNALRRLMEKYMTSCRVILCADSITHIRAPIKSRCLLIRIPAPTIKDLTALLQAVATTEHIQLPDQVAKIIVERSDRNIRKSLLLLQSIRVKQYPFTIAHTNIYTLIDWEQAVDDVAKWVLEEQSPNQMQHCRQRIQDVLSKSIPAEMVMKTLVSALYRRIDDANRQKLAHIAAFYNHRLARGSKPTLHIEALITTFAAHYLRHTISLF
jgi:replication factor C subunit 3/5